MRDLVLGLGLTFRYRKLVGTWDCLLLDPGTSVGVWRSMAALERVVTACVRHARCMGHGLARVRVHTGKRVLLKALVGILGLRRWRMAMRERVVSCMRTVATVVTSITARNVANAGASSTVESMGVVVTVATTDHVRHGRIRSPRIRGRMAAGAVRVVIGHRGAGVVHAILWLSMLPFLPLRVLLLMVVWEPTLLGGNFRGLLLLLAGR
jgi:hypothetical protein